MHIAFDNTYARDLSGFYTRWQPAPVPAPKLLYLNEALATELGLDAQALAGPEGLAMLSGNTVPAGAEPLAQVYAGHQFGGFSPQLGDGRALLLGEVINRHGQRRDIAFKGTGRTPYSRGGDGKAAVGPMLREVLIGEGMHALGVPTTRALAVAGTGEMVLREGRFPGAVLTRVAASHLRVGTFQFFAARGETEQLQRLVDYAIARHDPELATLPEVGDRALALLRAVATRQAALLAQWMNLGFIHGVMNTDNMTISGETIDYGPCAFIDAYDPAAVFSSIDHDGRYAYGNQPGIAQWNLARLGETLLPLIDPDEEKAVAAATEVLGSFVGRYERHMRDGLRAKLGLGAGEADDELAREALELLATQKADHTGFFRALSSAVRGDRAPLRDLLVDRDGAEPWTQRWLERVAARPEPAAEIADAMDRVNPVYIPRNHLVEEALAAAIAGDLAPLHRLLDVLARPFEARPGYERYALPDPDGNVDYQTFCGT